MKTKHVLRVLLSLLIIIVWAPQKVMGYEKYYQYKYTTYVSIEPGERITLEPAKLDGTDFYWYRSNFIGYGNAQWYGSSGNSSGCYITKCFYEYLSYSRWGDSFKCEVIGLTPGTYEIWNEWLAKNHISTWDPDYVRCNYVITVKSTNNPKLTISVSDTCNRVVKGTNISITPSVSGAEVYYFDMGQDRTNHFDSTYPTAGFTLTELGNISLWAFAVKRGYPASDEFKHTYNVIEPGDFHVMLANGADTHFKVISESDKTCVVYFVPESAKGDLKIPSQINGYKVKSIQKEAFLDCKNLTSVIIPDGITSIEDEAFKGCTALTSIKIPSSVTTIGNSAFYDCSALTSIDIPSSVKTIGNYAFSGCYAFTTINIPTSVTSIGDRAFWGCYALASIDIPSSVTNIGDWALCECSSLEKLEIPSGLSKIPEALCFDCDNLQEVVIPNSVKVIEGAAFQHCENLKSVISLIEDPFPIDDYTFSPYSEIDGFQLPSATLYVPKGCKNKYASTAGWLLFSKIEEIGTPGPTPEPTNYTDISQLDNVIYLEEVRANAGGTATLSFRMKNSAAIRGFQFDLYLPDGVTALKNAKGRIQGSLSKERLDDDDEHTLTFSEQADGSIRFLCGSQYDETFKGREGEIATLHIKIAEDMDDGEYPIELKNMRLSETDISKYYDTESVVSRLVINSYMNPL